MKLLQNKQYGTAVWKSERDAFMTFLRPQIPKTRCKACQGLGHGVQHKCASNKQIDALLKGMKGPFKSMWAAIKTAEVHRGPKMDALSEYKGKAIALANATTKAKSMVGLGEKRPGSEIDLLVQEIKPTEPDLAKDL